MAGISFAAPTAPATDATPAAQHASDKGFAFSSTFTDAARNATSPVEAKSRQATSKDKDKDDRDDKRDDSAPVVASAQHAASSSHARDDTSADAKKSGDKDRPSRAVAGSSTKSAARTNDAEASNIDTSETAVDAAGLAPVLDALKQAASATGQAVADSTPPAGALETPGAQTAAAQTAEPLPATASLLAARIVPAAAQPADAKSAAPSKKNARADAVADKAAAIDASATVSASADPQAQATPDSATVAQPSAGQQLASGGADRALDMAKQGAWLDGLARDIAATGDTSSTLRFQAAPTHLGAVQVEIARGLEGAAVTLTASSESSRTALADAKPQLIAEARAQGIHIASAHVDVSADPRQSNSGGNQSDHRHDPRGEGSFSSQSGDEGNSGRQSQTRSQPFAINQTAESQPVATADVEESTASAAPTGGMYA
ncbi:flagellar hook-length control protein FliK [Sphingomonas oryzagri]|uniref:Flagellar hook-length control protein FliK n=1 Tax=Sphingomonas oryzagri TaxID=3042314 RepID=A0ABT6N2S4_9SPHN|nr:flagellar hook-length control protein FliK [Sphingomonas oryzagri]MDH7639615.1 flagellar hook-length control protein FliK [Sphingomonas oryzagri]